MSDFELDLSKFAANLEENLKPELLAFTGPYGSGKSWIAASASEVDELGPVLYIDCEGSTTGTIKQFKDNPITVIKVKERFPGSEWGFIEKMFGSPKKPGGDLFTKKHPYKTIVIDPLNTVFEWAKAAGDVPGDGFAKWNFVHDMFTHPDTGLLARLKAADPLGIVILHEKVEGGEGDGPALATFRWQGQGTSQLGQAPDAIIYLTRDTNNKGESTTTAWTRPTKRNQAKNRFDLPHKIENPSMKKIYELIEGEN